MPALNPFQAYTCYLRDAELVPYVYQYVMDWNDAEDVVREVVAEVMNSESEFDTNAGPEGLREWLRKRCRQKAKSYLPAMNADRYTGRDDWENDEAIDPDEYALEVQNAKRAYESRRHLLTPLQEKCFVAEIAGESQTRIAAHIGSSVQNVNQHLRYARRKLNHHEARRAEAEAQSRRTSAKEVSAARRMMNELLVNIQAEQEE